MSFLGNHFIQDGWKWPQSWRLLSLPTNLTIKLVDNSYHNSPTFTLVSYFMLNAAHVRMLRRNLPHSTTSLLISRPSATITTRLPVTAYTWVASIMAEAPTSRQAQQLLKLISTPHTWPCLWSTLWRRSQSSEFELTAEHARDAAHGTQGQSEYRSRVSVSHRQCWYAIRDAQAVLNYALHRCRLLRLPPHAKQPLRQWRVPTEPTAQRQLGQCSCQGRRVRTARFTGRHRVQLGRVWERRSEVPGTWSASKPSVISFSVSLWFCWSLWWGDALTVFSFWTNCLASVAWYWPKIFVQFDCLDGWRGEFHLIACRWCKSIPSSPPYLLFQKVRCIMLPLKVSAAVRGSSKLVDVRNAAHH